MVLPELLLTGELTPLAPGSFIGRLLRPIGSLFRHVIHIPREDQ
jgi:hypothetical protein